MHHDPNRTLPKPREGHVPPGSQLTVTIGRNLAHTTIPMSDSSWTQFEFDVLSLVDNYFSPTMRFGPFAGTGRWDGVEEESLMIVVVTSYPGNIRDFERHLRGIAASFGQEGIAWSYGPNKLAEVRS